MGVRPAGEFVKARGCQPIISMACGGGAMATAPMLADIGGVFPMPEPRREEGEGDGCSSYEELSGKGAPTAALVVASFETGNTPECEKGYNGTPISNGCICDVIRTISVMIPWSSFSCLAGRTRSVRTHTPRA